MTVSARSRQEDNMDVDDEPARVRAPVVGRGVVDEDARVVAKSSGAAVAPHGHHHSALLPHGGPVGAGAGHVSKGALRRLQRNPRPHEAAKMTRQHEQSEREKRSLKRTQWRDSRRSAKTELRE
eukprot:CAMPEP_0170161778 /NCGR_PEP_ID=MMETSP0033_2-20121228/76762_1 /TAXON_ID=195969 /ORGANISM="Dolichomastix tenuilepis, Strain CCMP3274" /LENGTH=123 /DNA_ID=CAMNT_0010399401 /DNA_START=1076 /DNA_END=1447 /DNA_ORIENTATION=-